MSTVVTWCPRCQRMVTANHVHVKGLVGEDAVTTCSRCNLMLSIWPLKGGDKSTKYPMTKGRLVQKFNERSNNEVPKLDTKVQDGADNIKVGVAYEIINIEEVTTDVAFYTGIRCELLSQKAEEGTVMLWKRPITGSKSKLGAFITTLGDNTDKWLHKWIVADKWGRNDNEIHRVERPVEGSTKATVAKGVAKAVKAAAKDRVPF